MKKRIMSKPNPNSAAEEGKSPEATPQELETPPDRQLLPSDNQIYTEFNNATNLIIKTIESISSTITNKEKSNKEISIEEMNEIQSILFQTVPSHFLIIKKTNRALSNECYLKLQSQIKSKRQDIESQSIQLQNLIYEKSHLEREIRDCQEGFENELLLRVAKEELGSVDPAESGNGVSGDLKKDQDGKKESNVIDKNNDQEEKQNDDEDGADNDEEEDDETKIRQKNDTTINSFFSKSFSYRNPSRHQYNMSKLMSAITERGKLNNQVTRAKKRKNQLIVDLKSEQDFLKSIPGQIVKLEEWTIPIQDYFKKQRVDGPTADKVSGRSSTGDDNDGACAGLGVELLIGSERNDRLRKAQELSGPLYNLFIQFQSFLDVHCTKNQTNKTEENDDEEYDDHHDEEEDSDMNESENDKDEPIISDIHEWKLHVIDCDNKDNDALTTASVEATEKEYLQSENKAIQLWIPIPNILLTSSSSTSSSSSSSSKKTEYVKIQFDYLPKLQIITVHIANDSANTTTRRSGTKLSTALEKLSWSKTKSSNKRSSSAGQSISLLHNLFQNDTGLKLPHGCGANLCFDSEEDGEIGTGTVNDTHETKGDQEDETDEIYEMADEGPEMVDYDDDESEIQNNITKPSKGEIILQRIVSTLIQQNHAPKCYNWCQYLAGLHYSQTNQNNTNTATAGEDESSSLHYRVYPTTKSAMMRLSRRIRSHATLTSTLKMLQGSKLPSTIPIHPSMEDVLKSKHAISAKVDKCSEDTSRNSEQEGDHQCQHYKVTLKRKSKTLSMKVKIDPKYPAVPPMWSLQPTTASLNQNSLNKPENSNLYDTELGAIETDVNTLNDPSRFYNDKVEESYDWILLHQLYFITYSWDCYQLALDKGKSQERGNEATIAQRQRRGRDRRPIDNMHYALYKHGL